MPNWLEKACVLHVLQHTLQSFLSHWVKLRLTTKLISKLCIHRYLVTIERIPAILELNETYSVFLYTDYLCIKLAVHKPAFELEEGK